MWNWQIKFTLSYISKQAFEVFTKTSYMELVSPWLTQFLCLLVSFPNSKELATTCKAGYLKNCIFSSNPHLDFKILGGGSFLSPNAISRSGGYEKAKPSQPLQDSKSREAWLWVTPPDPVGHKTLLYFPGIYLSPNNGNWAIVWVKTWTRALYWNRIIVCGYMHFLN